ncbi:MAG: prepilin peptidase [Candidatus Pacebacteria bacterium]|nr:prepilin peptidase [Candidatus Paceibacterota bacterium]
MDLFIHFSVFIFGTIIGSFLNVVALRFNTGFGLSGRSQCFSCGYTLAWFDLIPILSYITHGAKCRKCKSPISAQYISVEILTGTLFVFLFTMFSSQYILFGLHLFIACILVVALVYDIKHKIIPDILSYLFILCASITLLVTGGSIVGILISIPFWLIVLISKETWMGGGDAKLAMGIGLLLGVTKGISALFIASWIGALVGIVLLFMHRKSGTIKRLELPFAPFLILGMYIVLFSGIDIIYVTSFF